MRGVRACWPMLAATAFFAMAWSLHAAAQPSGAPSGPPPNRQVTVQNETDLALQSLYLFPSGSADRGPDRLGEESVAPSATFRARLGRQASCTFDVVAIWQDGQEETRSAVNICRNPRLVFGDPALPTLDVAVANRSEVVLRALFARTSGAEAWGPDRLGSQAIEPNGSFRLRLRKRDCAFDLRAVFTDEREEVKERIDLCATRNAAFDRSTIPRLPARSLALVNRHLAAVQEVYVSSSTDTDWGPERLEAPLPLPVGQQATVTMEVACVTDIRIVFPNGGAEERREVDICAIPRIVLVPGWVLGVEELAEPAMPEMAAAEPPGEIRGEPVAAASSGDPPGDPPAEPSLVKLRNGGVLPIVEVYAAPPGEPRGMDRLGADVLGVGETLDLEAPDPDACAADLLVVFRDGREVTRTGVDLCQGEEIVIR